MKDFDVPVIMPLFPTDSPSWTGLGELPEPVVLDRIWKRALADATEIVDATPDLPRKHLAGWLDPTLHGLAARRPTFTDSDLHPEATRLLDRAAGMVCDRLTEQLVWMRWNHNVRSIADLDPLQVGLVKAHIPVILSRILLSAYGGWT